MRPRRVFTVLAVLVLAALVVGGTGAGDWVGEAKDGAAPTCLRLASPTLHAVHGIRVKSGSAPGTGWGGQTVAPWLPTFAASGERRRIPPDPYDPDPVRLPLASRAPPRD